MTKFNKAEESEDLVSAAEALTQLTHTPGSDNMSIGSSSTLTPEPVLPSYESTEEHPLVTRVNQVTRHPLVTNAVKYYESSKRNYAPFNYAAEIVEKAALPVVNKIEVNLNSRHQASLRGGPNKRRLLESREEKLETTQRLHFCLHILKLANDNINSKVNFLQQKVVERERTIKEEREKKRPIDDPQTQQTKTEIVTTVRKIIHLILNFKPSSLSSTAEPEVDTSPESDIALKTAIRDIILKLPSTIQQSAITNSTSAQQQANDRIFVFAKESLEMITKLTNVFSEQLERAENWIGGDEKDVDAESTVYENTGSESPIETKRVKYESV